MTTEATNIDAKLLDRAGALLSQAERVVVLTGAGVSAESGIPTFRGSGGLWEDYRVEDVATPEAFQRDPQWVWRFYNSRRGRLWEIQPNPAHHALAKLEARCQAFTLVTQNVDGLHQKAGSRRVLEVHGNLGWVRCTVCESRFDRTGQSLPELPECDHCGGLLRPDVVWFGEMLPTEIWRQAAAAVLACELLLVVGTSAQVHPAASLAWSAKEQGASVVQVNLEPTPADEVADVSLYGPAGQILPAIVERIAQP